PRTAPSCAWTALICSASVHARGRRSAILQQSSMAKRWGGKMVAQVMHLIAGARVIPAGDRSARARLVIALLALGLIVVACFSIATGASDASALALIRSWFVGTQDAALTARDRLIVYEIRLPRVVLGMLVGAALAVSGALMQGLFRNPLADPGIVGVSAGAGLGAITVIVLGGTVLGPLVSMLGLYALPIAAFLGGLATTLLLYRIGTSHGQTSVATMLLAGIALAALSGALA